MLGLAIALKIVLIVSALVGAGLVLAGASLGHPGIRRLQRSFLGLVVISAMAAFSVVVYRLGGGFDLSIAEIVAKSPPGYAAGLLISGAAIGMLPGKAATLGAALIVGAFAVAGHAAAQSVTSGLVAGAHVGAGAWWTGGLLLLASTYRNCTDSQASDLLERFSRQALPIVAVLLVAGGWVTIELMGLSLSGFATTYGGTLLAKVGLAVTAIGVAIYNRLRLVPAIRTGDPAAQRRLRRHVLIELSLIGLLAVVTGVLTSNMSPPTIMQ